MAYTPSLEEIITLALDTRMRDMFGPMPGKIVAIDHSDNTVDVEIQVRMPVPTDDDSTTHEELPILPAVPILWPRSASAAITFPIAPGDTGLVLILGLSVSGWLDSGQVSDPGDTRGMHVSNAVFLPGFCAKADKPASASDPALVIDAAAIKLGAAAAEYVARADKVAAKVDAILTALNGVTYLPGPGTATKLFPNGLGSCSAADVACDRVKGE